VDGTLAKCNRFISEQAIGKHIEILSNISDSQILHLFRTAKVVVYPSLCEGFGMPIIESMLLNPHTVFSNTTAMSDFTFAPQNTFDPTDIAAIVEIVRDELSDHGFESNEWQAQRKFIASKYHWAQSALVLSEIHNTVLVE
jgi:glycosyltransferase involved in cell wall biosynthesis